jgi:hypothetical protein
MAIANVQGPALVTSATGNVTPTLAATTAGNLLVAVLMGTGNITFSTPANWQQAVAIGLAGQRIEIWYLKNCPAGQTSFAFTSTNSESAGEVSEYSGADTVAPLDVTGTANGTTSYVTVSTSASAASGDLGVALASSVDVLNGGIVPIIPAGWTSLGTASNWDINLSAGVGACYQLGVSGIVSCAFTGTSGGGNKRHAIVTFKAAGAGGGSPNNSGLWGGFNQGVPGVTIPQLVYTDPTTGLQASPWMGLAAYEPDGPTARLFIKWGTDVIPPPPIVAPTVVIRALRPEWIRPTYYREPTQDARALTFPAFHSPVTQKLRPEWTPPTRYREPTQSGTPLPFPAFRQPVTQKLRPDWIPPTRYREPTQDARPLPFPAFHGEKLYAPPDVRVPSFFQLIQVAVAPLIVLPLLVVPYPPNPKAPGPQWFLAPAQAGDPLPYPAFFQSFQKLSPGAPPPGWFLAPSQAGDPLPFPTFFQALQKLSPAVGAPVGFITPSQDGRPLPFPALFQALQKLSPNAPNPAQFLAPAQAGDPLLFFNVTAPQYSFRVPGSPLAALFLAPSQDASPLLFFNVAAPSYSFGEPQWVPPSFAIAPLLIVIPSTPGPTTVWWLKSPFNPF